MDVDRMSGSTLEAMADAVERSAVVLVCVSKRYKESQVSGRGWWAGHGWLYLVSPAILSC